jgi:5-methylcytosine-specific restriction endonuclease McrA
MENKLCKCGCGTPITSKWQKYQNIEYIKGHGRKNRHNSFEHNEAIKLKNMNGKNIECQYCKKLFYCQMSKIERGKKYCSKDCYNLAMIGKPPLKAIQKIIGTHHIVLEETRKKIGFANNREKNGMWQDGNGYKPYDNNFKRTFKNLIRKRDNQICMNCGIHREKLSQALHIHHVDYNKQNTTKENCISLCNSCHGLTRINKEYWITLLREKLSKNYGYGYENEITFEILEPKLKKAGL